MNVLFLCTGNSARSVMAEALLNHIGAGKFTAYSAGSSPTGRVNPYALQLLQRTGIPTVGLRSKAWDEFALPGAPHMDFIITVCDNAAGEVCPVWPGQPTSAHWGVEDPAAVEGDDLASTTAFRKAFGLLQHRIRLFAALPLASLDNGRLKATLQEIGRSAPDA